MKFIPTWKVNLEGLWLHLFFPLFLLDPWSEIRGPGRKKSGSGIITGIPDPQHWLEVLTTGNFDIRNNVTYSSKVCTLLFETKKRVNWKNVYFIVQYLGLGSIRVHVHVLTTTRIFVHLWYMYKCLSRLEIHHYNPCRCVSLNLVHDNMLPLTYRFVHLLKKNSY